MTAAEFYDDQELEGFVGRQECIRLMQEFNDHAEELRQLEAQNLKNNSLNNGLKEQ